MNVLDEPSLPEDSAGSESLEVFAAASTPGYREFEFDLPEALLKHLVVVLDHMQAASLTPIDLACVPETQGVYQLFHDDNLVYIGKTDAEAGLLNRLTRHSGKIQHRQNLDPGSVTFKAVRIYVFTAMDLETQLIRHYGNNAKTAWNGSGFGANDPGRKRDTSKPGVFDTLYPIDIDRDIELDFGLCKTAADVARQLKQTLPYTFRFQGQERARRPHDELALTNIAMPASPYTARRAIEELVRQLPPGWQATALSALVILYKEEREDYPQATIIARS